MTTTRSSNVGGQVRRLLDLSTGHLPASLAHGGLGTLDGVVADRVGPYGSWLLGVPTDPDVRCDDEVVVRIWRHAREQGCDYVLFDRDAATTTALPTYHQ